MDILLILVRIIFFTLFLFIITVIGTSFFFVAIRKDRGEISNGTESYAKAETVTTQAF
jgi:hypothetical protein